MPSRKAAPPKGGVKRATSSQVRGKPVSSSSELPRIVGKHQAGNKASMEVWRKGVTREITVTVG